MFFAINYKGLVGMRLNLGLNLHRVAAFIYLSVPMYSMETLVTKTGGISLFSIEY